MKTIEQDYPAKARGDASATIPNAQSRFVARLFFLCGLLLIAFWGLLLSVFVVHKTYVGPETSMDNGRLEPIWAFLLAAALGWALLNLYWSVTSLQIRSSNGFYNHLAIAIGCGAIAIGIQAVMFAHSLTMQPLVMDYSKVADNRQIGQAIPPPADAGTSGDPVEGQKVFSTICLTCHGPTGRGMPNLAPSLVGSAFVASADNAAVARVIRLGRALGEPNNKSGKVMPARGGNPFLTEQQISHLVAFVRSIQDGGSMASTSNAESVPTIQLAKWVVPFATEPPKGLDSQVVDAEKTAGLARRSQQSERRQALIQGQTLALTGVHGLFLLGVVVLSSNWLITKLTEVRHETSPMLGNLSVSGWVIAAVAWILVAWFCFWWK